MKNLQVQVIKYLLVFYLIHQTLQIYGDNLPDDFYQRNSNYDVTFYFIDLTFNNANVYIQGNVTINAIAKDSVLKCFAVELVNDYIIDSITINKSKVSYTHQQNVIYAYPDKPIAVGNLFSVQIFYRGSGHSNGIFGGITSSADYRYSQFKVTWTLSEPFNARDWFPCKQVLSDKADSVYVFITVPKGLKAGSNGLLKAIRPINDSMVRYEWKSRYPIAYYLISVSVAKYRDYSFYAKMHHGDSILVQNFVYDNDSIFAANKEKIDTTGLILNFYSDLFGEYPFIREKYGHCHSPFQGGMEHQTMTTIQSFDFGLVAHELAHQWFGDMVTCATWQDISMNEGFASYLEYLSIEKMQPANIGLLWLQQATGDARSETTGSIYVPYVSRQDEERLFDVNLTYKKGAMMLHMLRYELDNDSLFYKVLKTYLQNYKYSVATGAGFAKVARDVTGMDFTWFFNQWYFGEGIPVFKINWAQSEDSVKIESVEKGSSSNPSFFNTKMEYLFHFTDGSDTGIIFHQNAPLEKYNLVTKKKVDSITVDPANWILKDATIKNVRFNDSSLLYK